MTNDWWRYEPDADMSDDYCDKLVGQILDGSVEEFVVGFQYSYNQPNMQQLTRMFEALSETKGMKLVCDVCALGLLSLVHTPT